MRRHLRLRCDSANSFFTIWLIWLVACVMSKRPFDIDDINIRLCGGAIFRLRIFTSFRTCERVTMLICFWITTKLPISIILNLLMEFINKIDDIVLKIFEFFKFVWLSTVVLKIVWEFLKLFKCLSQYSFFAWTDFYKKKYFPSLVALS